MASKKPSKGSSSGKPSSRDRKAQRLVDSGQHATIQDAKRAIYRAEYEGRNAKAKREHFESYSAKRSRGEGIKEALQDEGWEAALELIQEFSDDPDMEAVLWKVFRDNYRSSKG